MASPATSRASKLFWRTQGPKVQLGLKDNRDHRERRVHKVLLALQDQLALPDLQDLRVRSERKVLKGRRVPKGLPVQRALLEPLVRLGPKVQRDQQAQVVLMGCRSSCSPELLPFLPASVGFPWSCGGREVVAERQAMPSVLQGAATSVCSAFVTARLAEVEEGQDILERS